MNSEGIGTVDTHTAAASDSIPWWQQAVVYQIYPRSFADGDGDGIGDLTGLLHRLDYIAALGVDAIWLSPIFPSPGKDFGYDVADYCDIDPSFGTLAQFDELVARAHERGLRVVLDWVPNHTSDQHRWFVDASSSAASEHRDFYVWADPAADGGPPNNWLACFPPATQAWTFHAASGQYYLHNFLDSQPDLNWRNPTVAAAMMDTLRFWLDRGVDGFRMDVINLICKPADLGDDPDGWVGSGLPHLPLNDEAETHIHLRGIRSILDSYPQQPMSVGEVYLLNPAAAATYLGRGDELHLGFNFAPIYAPWDADAFRAQVDASELHYSDTDGRWPTWVLSNHDQPRHRSRFGSNARARAAAVLLLTLRGTPFMYAGEELGLPDAVIDPAAAADPGGRDGCRAPIPWEVSPDHGWPTPAWLPFVDEADRYAVARQEDDPGSMLALYRAVLAERRASTALRSGTFGWLDAPTNVLAWRRDAVICDSPGAVVSSDRRFVVINFSGDEVQMGPAGADWADGLTVRLSTVGSSGGGDTLRSSRAWRAILDPNEAIILS